MLLVYSMDHRCHSAELGKEGNGEFSDAGSGTGGIGRG